MYSNIKAAASLNHSIHFQGFRSASAGPPAAPNCSSRHAARPQPASACYTAICTRRPAPAIMKSVNSSAASAPQPPATTRTFLSP